MKIQSNSPEQTQSFSVQVLNSLNTNIVGLIGDLGTGKTTFIQGIGKNLGITSPITSPTFLILKSYAISNGHTYKRLIHVDAYRISSWDELATLGLHEMWANPSNLIMIEWADNVKQFLPEQTKYIYFKHINERSRDIAAI